MSSSADPAAVQLRLASLLSGAQFRPVLPGPAAIVYIRKLRDPLPGRLKLNSGCALSAAWERAVSESISQLAGNAARPALGQVPADAESVLFLDRSEMLACLASDWIEGRAILHWWWRSLFRASDVTSAVAREWLTSIEYVPAAFVKLAQKGNAIEFAASLPLSVVDRLLDEITRKFGLTDLRIFLSHSKLERQPPAIGLSYQSKPSRSKLAEPLSFSELTEVRTRLAPEAFAQGLTPDARLLLGLALLLERTPALLRERTFARRLMASLLATGTTEVIDVPTLIESIERSQGEVALERGRPSANEDNRPEPRGTHPPRGGETATGDLGATNSSDAKRRSDYRVQQDGARAQVEEQSKSEAVRASLEDLPVELYREPDTWNQESVAPPVGVSTVVAEHPRAGQVQADEAPRATENNGSIEVQATEAPRATENNGSIEVQATEAPRATENTEAIEVQAFEPMSGSEESPTTLVHQSELSPAVIEVACETRLGGIFYLINAALALNLYSDFTKPLDPGIELSIWNFLALTGPELTGNLFESDPIWALLARLAGRRQGEQPGIHFNAPEEWRMPPGWLDAFPDPGDWSYQTSRGRLTVRHPDDFTVLSVKLGPLFRARDIAARLANETSCYSNIARFRRKRFVRDGFGLRGRERRLERWTRWIVEYLRARLARAVGIVPAGELVATTVFSCAARVEVTPARLDVFFSLAELPVEVRLSGLDRDPGWVPAAGRSIAFHFD